MKQDFIIIEPAEPIEFGEAIQQTFTITKPDVAHRALAFVNRVLEQGNPLSIVEKIAAWRLFFKNVEEDFRLEDYVLEELNKTQGKVTLASGTKIERMEAGTKYIFTNCNDSELHRLEWAAEAAANAVKDRKEFLKKVPKEGMTVVNGETGEVETIYPPIKSSISTYKVTLSAKDNTPDLSDDLPF
jgi:hypothetical protein